MKWLLYLLLPLVYSTSIFEQSSKGRCVPITFPLCMDIPYNYTYTTSLVADEHDATLKQTEHFKPLFKTKCHPQIQFLVCSVFAPMCPEQMPQMVTSCRSVCEEVRSECMPILVEFGFDWPERLECSLFPSPPDLCMKPSEDEKSRSRAFSGESRVLPPSRRLPSSSSTCPSSLVDVDPHDRNAPCAFPCNGDVMFTADDKAELRRWLPSLGGCDLVFSLFTFLTFLIDRKRFRFPERCIFYLALCNAMHSVPYLLSLLLPSSALSCHSLPTNGQTYLIIGEMENILCTLTFIVSYFSSLAAAFWWLMFTFTWYLSASRKWVQEGLEATAVRVHVIAWFGPLLAVVLALATHSLDGNELTGLCGVGNQSERALLIFSLIPRAILAVAGVLALLAGISSMCSERKAFRTRGTDTSKLDKLMLKMCLFGVLYVLPLLTTLLTEVYSYRQLLLWLPDSLLCKQYSPNGCALPRMPNAHIYQLQVASSLLGFIAPLVWILSLKTCHSWQRKFCCCIWQSSTVTKASAAPLLQSHTVPLPQAPPPRSAPLQYVPLSTTSRQWPKHV